MGRFPGVVICYQVGFLVRVFRPYGLVDRLSDRLFIRNIPMSMYMDRRSRYRGGGSASGKDVLSWYSPIPPAHTRLSPNPC